MKVSSCVICDEEPILGMQSNQFTHYTPTHTNGQAKLQANVVSKATEQTNGQSNGFSIKQMNLSMGEVHPNRKHSQVISNSHGQTNTNPSNIQFRQNSQIVLHNVVYSKMENQRNGNDIQFNSIGTKDSPDDSRAPLKRKRVAVSKACWHCRKAHAKCSDDRPCTRCIKKNIPCVENEPDDEKDVSLPGSLLSSNQIHSQNVLSTLSSPYFNTDQSQYSSHLPFPLPFQASNRRSNQIVDPSNLQSLISPNHSQYSQYSPSVTSEDVSDGSSVPYSAQNDMTFSLTQTIKQQALLIQQLIERQNQNVEPLTRDKVKYKDNPFIEGLIAGVPSAIWREDFSTAAHELVFANDEFFNFLDCNRDDIMGVKFGVDDIPRFLMGRFGKKHVPTSANMHTLELSFKKVFNKLKSKVNAFKTQAMDSIYYMRRRAILAQKIIETTLVRRNGFVFQNYRQVEVFDDEVMLNDVVFPKTFETRSIEDLTIEMFMRSLQRIGSIVGVSQDVLCPSPHSRSTASPSPSPVSTPIHPSMTEDELFPSISLEDLQLDGLEFYFH